MSSIYALAASVCRRGRHIVIRGESENATFAEILLTRDMARAIGRKLEQLSLMEVSEEKPTAAAASSSQGARRSAGLRDAGEPPF